MRRRATLAAACAAAMLILPCSPARASRKKKRGRTPEPTAVPRPADPWRVTLTTSDGISLAASWRPIADRPKAPAVLLLHDFSRERREWEPIASELNARGFATLAVDLRAHGESTRTSGQPLKLTPRLLGDASGFPRDVEAACLWLRERTGKVGVIGLSIGGDLAVLATASGWADAAVVVSANFSRLARLAGNRPTAAKGSLFLASEDDPQRAASARAFLDAAKTPKKLALFGGAAHNFVLFLEHPEAKREAFEWLGEQLGVKPPPAPAP